jgi:two-component system, chemotaxis family, chemotaxis protein CheY
LSFVVDGGKSVGTLVITTRGSSLSKKILVVDDTTDTRELLHLYLKTAGYTIFVAADGGEGLYRAKMDEPDLIITDINMPNLDGFGMIRELRATEQFADLPIIALTAYGEEQLARAREAGANEAVTKPMIMEELVELVNSLLAPP